MVNGNKNFTNDLKQDSNQNDTQKFLTRNRSEHKDIRRKFEDDIEIAQEFNPLYQMGDYNGLFAGMKTRALVEEGEKKLLNSYKNLRKKKP
jgi:hypothetical protein